MARRHEWNDVAPEVARRGKPVQKHHGLAGAPSPGSVVVDARAGEIQELTAHW